MNLDLVETNKIYVEINYVKRIIFTFKNKFYIILMLICNNYPNITLHEI